MRDVLKLLLTDKTLKAPIVFGSDSYADLGAAYAPDAPMTPAALLAMDARAIQPRVMKDSAEQQERTRKKAEVFTPSWICAQMNDFRDEQWFGRANVFGTLEGTAWQANPEPIRFAQKRSWQSYVRERVLEITCGEAPFLVSRYDAASGESVPIPERIGILDRKLRVVGENTQTEAEWQYWALRAFRSVYGYEWQGDNLLIGRVNLLLSYAEYTRAQWGHEPEAQALKEIANVIAWNLWQMDGLSGTLPYAQREVPALQTSFFGAQTLTEPVPCRMMDWSNIKQSVEFNPLGRKGMRKFDFVIGNPPYQEDTKDTSDRPVYNNFVDAAYECADAVELITPARFLFNAGKTPKAWNEKMLNDKHFKVLDYRQDSSKVFPNTDIKGGVAIIYRNSQKNFEPVGVFTSYSELNTLKDKVIKKGTIGSLSDFVFAPESYKFAPKLHEDYPNLRYCEDKDENNSVVLSKGHDNDIVTNIFSKLPQIFVDQKTDNDSYAGFIGLVGNKRQKKWIKREYIQDHSNLEKYKVILPKSNGSGAIGEVLSTPLIGEPLIGEPLIGHTQSFISIGSFNTRGEAEACLKYVKTKFARALLGILKVTQDNKKDVWKYVPLQDFTERSDIDWSASVAEIDRQLYRKYGLDENEIAFIETHVKAMV